MDTFSIDSDIGSTTLVIAEIASVAIDYDATEVKITMRSGTTHVFQNYTNRSVMRTLYTELKKALQHAT